MILREMVKEQEAMPYRLVGGTYISFSHDMFRFFKELESGEFSSSSWFVRTHFPLSADRLIATVP